MTRELVLLLFLLVGCGLIVAAVLMPSWLRSRRQSGRQPWHRSASGASADPGGPAAGALGSNAWHGDAGSGDSGGGD